MSPTASVHDTNDVPLSEQARPVEKVNEYEDAEKNYQPKFWTIMVGMYLSIFLVALVSLVVLFLVYTRSSHAGRIEPSSQQPFHASPTTSNPSRTSDGMAVPTC